MKRGPTRGQISWPSLNWAYSNRSLARLLDCDHQTVIRMRAKHAPETCCGTGRSPASAERDRSGVHAPEPVLRLAGACRSAVHELAGGRLDPSSVRELRALVDAVERGQDEREAAE